MDGYNMEPSYNNRRVTLQHILQAKDLLSYPLQVNEIAKEAKNFTEVRSDVSAAFLGPNLWDDYKNAFIDLDSVLGNDPNTGILSLENLDQAINENVGSQNQIPNEENPSIQIPSNPSIQIPSNPSIQIPRNYASERSPMRSIEQSDSTSVQSFTDGQEKGAGSFSVDCKFSPFDLALATPPGHKHYDPSSAILQEEELKPQPIIKKSRKNFVPDNLKDDKYWARRQKNNMAAKRSREARRVKENQIVLRTQYLERENNSLKENVVRLQQENDLLKERMKKYEP